MKKSSTLRDAVHDWLDTFSHVPGSVIDKLVSYDDAVACYASDTFRLLASPQAECSYCDDLYSGSETLADLTELHARGKSIACTACDGNPGDQWRAAPPQYAFPCAWSTLFAPKDNCDQCWLRQHADEVARLGIYVFETEDWGVVLGIAGAGFDFVEAYWEPLYRLRGLRWHEAA